MIDLPTAAWTAGGMIGVKALPALVKNKFWAGLPTSGPMGYLTKLGTAALLGMVAGMLGQKKRAQDVVTGAVAATLFDAYQEFAAPMLGLSGFMSTDELEDLGMRGFITTPDVLNGMGRQMDIPSEILAA